METGSQSGEPPLTVVSAPDAEGDIVVVASGEVDLATAHGLQEVLRRAAGERQAGAGVVLDCSAVRYLDSTGLRVLVDMRALLGAGFVLRAPSPAVRRLLRLTGLEAVLMPAGGGPETGGTAPPAG